MSDLQLTRLVKRYGTVEALAGLDLEVSDGEFFCLLGPSAAGKTTALRAIAGLAKPDEGSVRFAGRDVTSEKVQGRQMAMIFQTFALYPHLTVSANLAYPLREARLPGEEIRRRVGEIAAMLKITHTLERKPATLSGGEQQRVAIGRAIVRRPKLLLLDEPLTNLDAKLRHDMRAEFKRLHRELRMTMVYATPDQLEALTMGERIGVINRGRIVQVATPEALYAAPRDSFVATLVGAPRMNLIRGVRRGPEADAAVALPFLEVRGGPWARALAGFPVGSEVLFGFRPHDVGPNGSPAGPRFRASVRLTEPLGDVTVIDLAANGAAFKMVLPEEEAMGYHTGDEIDLALSVEHTHVFAGETGTAIR